MQMQGNTIFITGGSSGIGGALAEAFHQRGNHIIVSGRRQDRLQEICARHPGMAYFVLDVTDRNAIRSVARKVITDFPAVNCVFNNAGVQMRAGISTDGSLDDESLETEITTNLFGPIRVAAAFLPYLAQRAGATLVNVSSGLAFVPMARFPVYCATKAALHSWTMTLRYQWQKLGVKVIELIPPYVGTELGGPRKQAINVGPQPMPLDAFMAETMKELESDADEIAIADAKKLFAATSPESVKRIFGFMNG
jgi:uncharacterized oxidoreductase